MSLLEFANPLGWWWAALALPIIAFYILKVRLRRQPVSTLLFWDRVFEEKKPRAWWQQFRHWLSLLLQLLLLLLLVGALVDPLWSWQKNQRRKLVLIVDNSASMAAADASGKRRIDQAKQTAAALVRSLRAGDEMAILTAGGKPSVAIGLTDHVGSLIEALDRIPLTDAPTALADTVTTARRLLPQNNQSHVFVLTDGCDPATGELSQKESITLYGFGEPADNVAITQFQARRSLLDAVGYQVLIEVTNLGDQPQKCQLDLSLEDELVDVLPVELEPGASKTLNLDQASSTGGRLVARLDCQDGLAVDNVAMAILPVRQKMHVELVTPGSVFLQSVLESIPLVELSIRQTLADSAADSVASSADDSAADPEPPRAAPGVRVIHRQVPQQLPPGKLFVIDPLESCDLWTVGEAIEQPIVSSVAKESPITQHVKLTNVLFPAARLLEFHVDAETLIGTPLDEPLLVHIRRPQGDVLVLNLDLDQGDLPLRIAFPVLMKNAIEWFQGVRAELQPSIATGSAATVDLRQAGLASDMPQAASATAGSDSNSSDESGLVVVRDATSAKRQSNLWVRDPHGGLTPLAHDDKQATISLLALCGVWTIGSQEDLARDPWQRSNEQASAAQASGSTASASSAGGKEAALVDAAISDTAIEERLVRVASNLCNRDESDLRPSVELELPGSLALLGWGGWSIWFYLAALALVMFAIEWGLYQRRVVG